MKHMSRSLTRTRSLNPVFIIASFVAAIFLVVNSLKRADIIMLSPATQLAAPLAQLMAIGLVVGICNASPAMRGRLGSIGAVLYTASLVLLVGVEFVINLVFPYLPPNLIGELRAGPLGIAFTVASLSFLLGTLVFFSAFRRVPGSSRSAILVGVLSSVPIALRTAFPEVVLEIGLVGLAAGVTMLAMWLIRSRRVQGISLLPAVNTLVETGVGNGSLRPELREPSRSVGSQAHRRPGAEPAL
jgi:hypothetical protein